MISITRPLRITDTAMAKAVKMLERRLEKPQHIDRSRNPVIVLSARRAVTMSIAPVANGYLCTLVQGNKTPQQVRAASLSAVARHLLLTRAQLAGQPVDRVEVYKVL